MAPDAAAVAALGRLDFSLPGTGLAGAEVLRMLDEVGSPATVTQRLQEIYDEVGGFGHLLLFCFDYSGNPQAWRESMRLLAHEVMPKVAHLTPRTV